MNFCPHFSKHIKWPNCKQVCFEPRMAIQGQGQHLNLKECSLVSRSRINYDQIMPSMSSLCYGFFEFQVTLHPQKVATKCTILWHPICYYFPLLESVFLLGVACKIMRQTQWCGMAVFHKLNYTSCPACPTSKNASYKMLWNVSKLPLTNNKPLQGKKFNSLLLYRQNR